MPDGGPFESLRTFLDQEEAEDRFSGTVVIESGAETILAGAYGHAHLGLGVRNQLDTRFNLASITKMFTAVAVLQLVEQGRLSLSATIDDYLPELGIGMADRMTVHHLLCHQSGLGSYWNEKCRQRRSVLRTSADYLSLIDGEQPTFEPGTSAAYGNSGYLLLGGIIERASGEDYYDYLRQHVCGAAGMQRAGHLHLDHIEDFAHGYTDTEWEGPPHPEYRTDNVFQYPVHGSAAAGLYSSAPELIQFGRALRANALLGPRSVSLIAGQAADARTRLWHAMDPLLAGPCGRSRRPRLRRGNHPAVLARGRLHRVHPLELRPACGQAGIQRVRPHPRRRRSVLRIERADLARRP